MCLERNKYKTKLKKEKNKVVISIIFESDALILLSYKHIDRTSPSHTRATVTSPSFLWLPYSFSSLPPKKFDQTWVLILLLPLSWCDLGAIAPASTTSMNSICINERAESDSTWPPGCFSAGIINRCFHYSKKQWRNTRHFDRQEWYFGHVQNFHVGNQWNNLVLSTHRR